MFKTLVKHFIYDHAINVMFDSIQHNFMFADPDFIFREGTRISRMEVSWLGYIIHLKDVKVIKLKSINLLGMFIELSSTDFVTVYKDPTYIELVGPDMLITSEKAFRRTFVKCSDPLYKNTYFLSHTITVSQTQIKDIQK